MHSQSQPSIDNYSSLGVVSFSKLLQEELLQESEDLLRSLAKNCVHRLTPEEKEQVDFDSLDKREQLHAGIIRLAKIDIKYIQFIADAFRYSALFHKIILQDNILQKVAETIKCPYENLNFSEPHFRLDLPRSFEENVEIISLPYHQEGSYYSYNVSRKTGLVIWMTLFDCGRDQGSLEYCEGSNKEGLFEHEKYYEDVENKRFLRHSLSNEIVNRFPLKYAEVKRGDVLLQHFDTIHRSGINSTENYVRYTFLARASNILSEDYTPQSWKHLEKKD